MLLCTNSWTRLLRTALLNAFVVAIVCLSHPTDRCHDTAPAWNPSAGSSQVLVSIPEGVHPRRSLDDLIRKPELRPELDLFLQAYLRIQQRPHTSPVSYFQLASIHGQPYVAWDGVRSLALGVGNASEPINGTRPGQVDTFAGYCWHASVLFPTWHRAYTLLVEQEVRKEALVLAQGYPPANRSTYLAAAHRLRFPFWDWTSEAAAASGVPELVLQRSVSVMSPEGRTTIRNPLESFTLPADVAQGSSSQPRNTSQTNGETALGGARAGNAPSLKGNRTLRHPDIHFRPQNDRLQEDLISQITQSIRPAWFSLFTDPNTAQSWARFATHAPSSDGRRPPTSLANIEGIHDLVHDVLGGIAFSGETGVPGHMSDVDIAAFDPIFFLHHANVDRLTALFQSKNPGTWLQHTVEPHARSYVTGLHGYAVTSSTPLWPFRKAPDTFITSNDVRDIEALGYTYPDFLEEEEEEEMGANAHSPAGQQAVAPGCQPRSRQGDVSEFRMDNYAGFRWYLNFHDVPTSICSSSALLSVYLQESRSPGVGQNNTDGLCGDSAIFVGSVGIFSHSSSCEGYHDGAINGQVDLTEQLLAFDLIGVHDEAYYASLPDSAAPGPEERPPDRLLQDYTCIIIACREGSVDMEEGMKSRLLSLSWGRLVGGMQVVGT